MSTGAPISGAVVPAIARHIIPLSPTRATAAPVPRVIEQARLAINVKATFTSASRDLNSYCTEVETVETPPDTDESDSGSRLKATPEELPEFPAAPRLKAESRTTHRGAFQLGVLAFTVSHSRSRARASSGRSEKRTPARPSASAQATSPVLSRETSGSPSDRCN